MKIKINEMMLTDVELTRSNGLLAMCYPTEMTLSELAEMYDKEHCPEVRFIDNEGLTTEVYKNHDLTSIKVSKNNDGNYVEVVLQVLPVELSEADIINEKLQIQADKIIEQAGIIADQKQQIEAQVLKITELENAMIEARVALEETRATSDMLLESILDMSEIVYA